MAGTSASPDIAHQDKGPMVLVTIWTLTALSTLFVAARIIVRFRVLQKAGLDDLLIGASLVVGFAYSTLTTLAVNAGYGQHPSTLTAAQLERAKFYNVASYPAALLSFSLPKLAVIALLTRLLAPHRSQRILLWSLGLTCLAMSMGCVAILFTMCDPTEALWRADLPHVKCADPAVLVNYSIFVGAYSALVDLYLAVYPATVLWRLHINRKKKIGISVALGLGVVATVMAVVKTTRLPSLYNQSDFTYSTADLFVWTDIESNTIIIAASIPTLAPLMEVFFGKRALSTTDPYPYNVPSGDERLRNSQRSKDTYVLEMKLNNNTTTQSSKVRGDDNDHDDRDGDDRYDGRYTRDVLNGKTNRNRDRDGYGNGGNDDGNRPTIQIERRDDVYIQYERRRDSSTDSGLMKQPVPQFREDLV